MYYLRKLSNLATVSKINKLSSIDDIPSDVLKQELATSGNTLSFWKCNTLDNTDDAIKAILLSGTKIEKCRFIVFDDNMLDRYSIKRDFDEPGKTGYIGFENLHVNLCGLTYKSIGSILTLLQQVVNNQSLTFILERKDVKEKIAEVCAAGLLNEEATDEHLMGDIEKYHLKTIGN